MRHLGLGGAKRHGAGAQGVRLVDLSEDSLYPPEDGLLAGIKRENDKIILCVIGK